MSTLPPAPEPTEPDLAAPGDPHPAAPGPSVADLEVDLAAFLPDGSVLADEGADEGDGEPPGTPAPTAGQPAVDLAALTRIEADLAAVDDALVALDAGDPGRSPLLVELLADERPTA